MKTLKKIAAASVAVIVLSTASAASFAANGNYGAAAVEENQEYTLEQMLTYAIQDEYLAYARYAADIEKFGEQRPFTNILSSEDFHIALLKTLFKKYEVPIPADTANEYITAPGTLVEALKAGVTGEADNLRMYEIFLEQEIPDDVRAVFTFLKNAAENHLNAFERRIARFEVGLLGRKR